MDRKAGLRDSFASDLKRIDPYPQDKEKPHVFSML